MNGCRWTDADDEMLLTYAGIETLALLARRMGRTENALKQRLFTMGVRARDAQGYMTAALAGAEYGINPRRIDQWARRGRLKARRGPRYWQIDPRDLERKLRQEHVA